MDNNNKNCCEICNFSNSNTKQEEYDNSGPPHYSNETYVERLEREDNEKRYEHNMRENRRLEELASHGKRGTKMPWRGDITPSRSNARRNKSKSNSSSSFFMSDDFLNSDADLFSSSNGNGINSGDDELFYHSNPQNKNPQNKNLYGSMPGKEQNTQYSKIPLTPQQLKEQSSLYQKILPSPPVYQPIWDVPSNVSLRGSGRIPPLPPINPSHYKSSSALFDTSDSDFMTSDSSNNINDNNNGDNSISFENSDPLFGKKKVGPNAPDQKLLDDLIQIYGEENIDYHGKNKLFTQQNLDNLYVINKDNTLIARYDNKRDEYNIETMPTWTRDGEIVKDSIK